MKKIILAAVVLLVAALFIGGVSAEDNAQAKIIIKSNANGASAALYNANGVAAHTGVIANGEAVFYVSTTESLKTAVVYGDGFKPNYLPISTPGAGAVATYTINLERVQTGLIGGSFGFIQALTNVPGAHVELHDIDHTTVQTGVADANGAVVFEVKTTAKPVSYVYASYETESGKVSNSVWVNVPEAGKTEVVYVPLAEPTPTESPLGAAVGILGVLGAALLLRKKE